MNEPTEEDIYPEQLLKLIREHTKEPLSVNQKIPDEFLEMMKPAFQTVLNRMIEEGILEKS